MFVFVQKRGCGLEKGTFTNRAKRNWKANALHILKSRKITQHSSTEIYKNSTAVFLLSDICIVLQYRRAIYIGSIFR